MKKLPEKNAVVDEQDQFEIERPHGAGRMYNFLISYKVRQAVEKLPFDISGLTVLDVCCGSGMISEYYSGRGAHVTGMDLSPEAIDRAKTRARKYNFQAEFRVGDATRLPFSDKSFDIVSVHDGLHHLEDPKRTVMEMTRVARKGIIIIEPARALITRLSVLLGISTDYEEVGNYVYRFKAAELRAWLRSAGIKNIRGRRYIMYYPHQPGKLFRILDRQPWFSLAGSFFYVLNAVLGGLGNKIQTTGCK
jgi:ubiquinone/menaquinone biosynthesis C-methylase UbiE